MTSTRLSRFLDYVPAIVAFVAAIVAVVGSPKWDMQASGIRKVTPLGWVVLCIGFCALIASLLVTARNSGEQFKQRKTREKISQIGKQQLLNAVNHVIFPFRDRYMYAEKHKAPNSPLDMLDAERRQTLEALNLNSRSPYADGTFKEIKWFEIIERAATNGRDQIVTTLQIYASYFSPEVMETATSLLNCEFLAVRLLHIHDIVDANTHGDAARSVPFFWVKKDELHNAGYEEFWNLIAAAIIVCSADSKGRGNVPPAFPQPY